MVSERIIAIVAAIALAAFVGVYVWSPFHAVETLGSAVRNRDRDALSVTVDFPAVRAGLKDQFAAKLASETTHDKAIAKNPLIGLALAFIPAIVDRIVDAVVTPDGIILLLSHPMGDHSPGNGTQKTKWNHSWRFIDLDHFKSEYSEDKNPDIGFGLVFERRGFFTWKLVRLDIPADEIAKRLERSGSDGPDDESGKDFGEAVLPSVVGTCAVARVKAVSTRLQDRDGTPVAGSGSAIEYANGGSQVSYDTIDGIEHSKPGDAVRLCLVSIPEHCPPGDNRGRVYSATNTRTHEQWTAPDAEHSCGGA